MYPIIDCVATGKRIKLIMKIKGISVKMLQQYLGFSCVQSIYHWLNGASMPSIDNLYALSELFQIPMDNIVCGNRKYHGKDRNIETTFRVWSYYILCKDSLNLYYQ